MKKPGSPNLPANPDNPVGGTTLIRKARADVNRRLADTRRWLVARLKSIPVARVTVNASVYQYQIDAFTLQQIVDEMRRRLEDPAMARTVTNRTTAAYEQGTASAVVNLTAVAPVDYTRTITSVLTSDRWQRRVALVQARTFEQMVGFAGETGTDLARVLSTGISDGKNPVEVARTIRGRFGVARSRAERIARTEITGALRRARWDEAEDARISLGVDTRMMHLSALSPTTRATHAARHGNLYTVQEVREFYSRDANSISCKCTQVQVAVDSSGNPVTDTAIRRARAAKKKFDG